MEYSHGTTESGLNELLSSGTPKTELKQEEVESDHYLFLSLDLVNSTKLKHQMSNDWPLIFAEFFSSVSYEALNNVGPLSSSLNIKPWKALGDEIIFRHRMTDFSQIPQFFEFASLLIEKITGKVRDFVLETLGSQHNHSTPYALPDVKGTIWHAEVKDFSNDTSRRNSRACQIFRIEEAPMEYEIIGPDLDIGFRISKFAVKGCFAIDIKLAYIIATQADYFSNKQLKDYSRSLFLTSFEQLKGVWDGNPYPIIIFKPSNVKITISENGRNVLDTLRETAQEYAIDKSLYELVDKLKSLTPESNGKRHPNHEKINPEIHCVAICFSKDHKTVYMGKRPSYKTNNANKFDCGCAKISSNETFDSTLKTTYLESYGLEINIVGANRPTPIATYTIGDDSTKITNGLIFTGIVETTPGKLEHLQAIPIDELPDHENCVEGLIDNINLALRTLREPVSPS